MRLEVQYKTKNLSFEVVYAKRKTIKIAIEHPECITVTVPIHTSKEQIINIVHKKGNWIVKKLDYFKEIDYYPIKRKFVDGESFMYLGRNYSLFIEEDFRLKKSKIRLQEEKIIITTNGKNEELLRKALEQWYRYKAKEVIKERVKHYQSYFNVESTEIKVKEQKKRWGSCTYDNKLLFNWRCVMATLDALDYIVVHEMCHMHHKNHSKNFWNLVESILPDYKARREWLRNNGIKMDI